MLFCISAWYGLRAGWLWRFPQADPTSLIYGQRGYRLSLYVGVAVLRLPQDSKRSTLLFAAATFFIACFDVAYAFFSTRQTWPYVELVAVWMWRYIQAEISPHKPSRRTLKQPKKEPQPKEQTNNYSLLAVYCTTSLQPNPDAESKTQTPACSAGCC